MTDGSVGPDHLVHKDGVLLLGVGNPLLDIIVGDEAGELVERFGLEADIAQEVDTLELGLLDTIR